MPASSPRLPSPHDCGSIIIQVLHEAIEARAFCCRQAAAPGGRPGKASRFVGLSKKFNRWKSLIKVCGRRKELGSFLGEEEAARCYDRHSVLAWGARCISADSLISLMRCTQVNPFDILLTYGYLDHTPLVSTLGPSHAGRTSTILGLITFSGRNGGFVNVRQKSTFVNTLSFLWDENAII
jgi:hypothetical protein